jgi:hypothetical protein
MGCRFHLSAPTSRSQRFSRVSIDLSHAEFETSGCNIDERHYTSSRPFRTLPRPISITLEIELPWETFRNHFRPVEWCSLLQEVIL